MQAGSRKLPHYSGHTSISQLESNRALLNVMEDLQETRKMVQREKVRAEAVLASIGDGLIAVDNNAKIMMVNRATEKILGWKANKLLGKIITSLPLENEHGSAIPLSERPTTISLATGKSDNVTYFFVRKNKTRFPLSILVTPIKLDGEIIGVIEVIRDVSREMKIDHAKTEFVSLASHQLRTPLGIIKWYLEALQNDDYFKTAPKSVRDYFKEIYSSNERVLSLVRDLLSVSRIEQGRTNSDPILIDPVQKIKEIVEQMQIVAHKKISNFRSLSVVIKHLRLS